MFSLVENADSPRTFTLTSGPAFIKFAGDQFVIVALLLGWEPGEVATRIDASDYLASITCGWIIPTIPADFLEKAIGDLRGAKVDAPRTMPASGSYRPDFWMRQGKR